MLGKDAFQEVDITGISMPITKTNYLVRDVDKLADTVREAFGIARSGRPGPVLIDITKDVTAAKVDYEPIPQEKHSRTGALGKLIRRSSTSSLLRPEPDQKDIDILVDMIKESKKPMLICGGGVTRSRAHEEFPGICPQGGCAGGHHTDGRRCHGRCGSAGDRNDWHARISGIQPRSRRLRSADCCRLAASRTGWH